MSSSNSRSVPYYGNYEKYYNYTSPARNSNEYQNRLRVTPPSSPFRFGVGSPSPMRTQSQSPRISKRRREENEKLEAVRKRNENRRRKEAAVKKAKEEAVKKSKSLEQQLKNAKTLSNLKKVYRKGALIKHPNKGGTKSNFQKWKNLFNTRKNSINLK
tara:strand:+ start:98 stop:571 length:474 start_codon:yes stop_codon:yes gene_type:complete